MRVDDKDRGDGPKARETMDRNGVGDVGESAGFDRDKDSGVVNSSQVDRINLDWAGEGNDRVNDGGREPVLEREVFDVEGRNRAKAKEETVFCVFVAD